MKAIILAAGRGKRLSPLTDEKPKCLIKIGKQTVLDRILWILCGYGIKEIIVVLGHLGSLIRSYLQDRYPELSLSFVYNSRYPPTGSMYSLWCGAKYLDEEFLLFDSDIIFNKFILADVLKAPYSDFIVASLLSGSGDEVKVFSEKGKIVALKKDTKCTNCIGEHIGIGSFTPSCLAQLVRVAEEAYEKNEYELEYEECIHRVAQTHPIRYYLTNLSWTEIDTAHDLQKAKTLTYPKILEEEVLQTTGTPWFELWKDRGNKLKDESDPIILNGFDSGLGKCSQQMVNQMVENAVNALKLTSTDSLLDVGCGAGMMTIPLSKIAGSVTATDISALLIAHLRKSFGTDRLYICQANSLPFDDATFDKVYSNSVFQYFPSLGYDEEALNEFIRVVKPDDGRIFIADVPDEHTKEACRAERKRSDPEKASDSALQHLFYSASFFQDFFSQHGYICEVSPQSIKDYGNSPFRFNVLAYKSLHSSAAT